MCWLETALEILLVSLNYYFALLQKKKDWEPSWVSQISSKTACNTCYDKSKDTNNILDCHILIKQKV